MNNIFKNYQLLCKKLNNNSNEEEKQEFLILSKELDVQLTKEFQEKIDKISATEKNIRTEISRIDEILHLIRKRIEQRNKLIDDYIKYIGYMPENFEYLTIFDDEPGLVAYRTNLTIANDIIMELITSGKKVASLKKQIKKRKKPAVEKEIEKIQKVRAEKIEVLKNDQELMKDLYNYCLTAPFNEENAYIQYIIIKLNSNGDIKYKLKGNNGPKSKVKSDEKKDTTKKGNVSQEKTEDQIKSGKTEKAEKTNKPLEEMPSVTFLGSVRPNNMMDYMKETVELFDDINIPNNGLIAENNSIKMDTKNIKND